MKNLVELGSTRLDLASMCVHGCASLVLRQIEYRHEYWMTALLYCSLQSPVEHHHHHCQVSTS